jgi:hypothetical protein
VGGFWEGKERRAVNFLQREIRNYELDVQGYDGAPLKLYIMNALKKIRY